MTAPTQPPDPRVQRIARELEYYESRPFTGDRYTTFARVLVEELGWREGKATDMGAYEDIDGAKVAWQDHPSFWKDVNKHVYEVLDTVAQNWNTHGFWIERAGDAIRKMAEERDACRAQQRENADTIKALKERAETAEAANTELDNARKSAEQSARDLRENNATLRARLAEAERVTEEQVERAAPHVYDAMRSFDAEGARYPWVAGGNSDMQDRARRVVRAAITAARGGG